MAESSRDALSRHRVWISIGSNAPDADSRIRAAVAELGNLLSCMEVSDTYVTPAIGKPAPDYTNCVAAGTTDISASDMIPLLKEIELRGGRGSCGSASMNGVDSSSSPRIVEIDLDLVVYGDKVLRPSDFNRQYFILGYNRLRNLAD